MFFNDTMIIFLVWFMSIKSLTPFKRFTYKEYKILKLVEYRNILIQIGIYGSSFCSTKQIRKYSEYDTFDTYDTLFCLSKCPLGLVTNRHLSLLVIVYYTSKVKTYCLNDTIQPSSVSYHSIRYKGESVPFYYLINCVYFENNHDMHVNIVIIIFYFKIGILSAQWWLN